MDIIKFKSGNFIDCIYFLSQHITSLFLLKNRENYSIEQEANYFIFSFKCKARLNTDDEIDVFISSKMYFSPFFIKDEFENNRSFDCILSKYVKIGEMIMMVN